MKTMIITAIISITPPTAPRMMKSKLFSESAFTGANVGVCTLVVIGICTSVLIGKGDTVTAGNVCWVEIIPTELMCLPMVLVGEVKLGDVGKIEAIEPADKYILSKFAIIKY